MKALVVFFGLVLGGVVLQWMQAEPNYLVAVERAYFQGVALFTYWIMDKFVWREEW